MYLIKNQVKKQHTALLLVSPSCTSPGEATADIQRALPLHRAGFITSEDVPGGPGLLKAQSVV